MKSNLTARERTLRNEIRSLLINLKRNIEDDFRCSDDPDDTTPGMQVTVATNDLSSWTYQTGDNSYSGGCYGMAHWSVIYLSRRSDCDGLATDAVNELANLCAEASV